MPHVIQMSLDKVVLVKLNAEFDITINGIRINRVGVANFLGVLIDEKLNWKDHIANVKSKLSKSTAILYKCIQVIDSQSMHILYSSLFLPYISYCSEIWGNTYPSNVNCLVVLQKRAIRLLFGAGRLDHTTPLFYRSHIYKIPDLVKFKTAMFMYKAYYYVLPANIQQHFVKKRYLGNNTSQKSISKALCHLECYSHVSTYVWHKSLEFLAC